MLGLCALFAGAVTMHCSSNLQNPLAADGGSVWGNLGDAQISADTKAPGAALGASCTSAAACANPDTVACCVHTTTGTTKGTCTLRSECVSGSGTGSGGASVGGGADLCSSGVACTGSAKCAVETCVAPNVSICSGSEFCAGATGSACASGAQCSSGYCDKGKCEPCTSNAECSPQYCDDGVCKGTCTSDCTNGDSCTADSQCVSGFCDKGKCAACTMNTQCPQDNCVNGVCEAACTTNCAVGDICATNSQCASDNCVNGRCAGPCTSACPNGSPCDNEQGCESQNCVNNVCVAKGTCLNCGSLTTQKGQATFGCQSFDDNCGGKMSCSCLAVGEACSPCPKPCDPPSTKECPAPASGTTEVCCALGTDAGGFCLDKISITLDGSSVGTSCPSICNPGFGPGCSGGETCCQEIKWNICAGACIKGSCPTPRIPDAAAPYRPPPPPLDAADYAYANWLAEYPNDAGCYPWTDAH
jgi:hypothetical protein